MHLFSSSLHAPDDAAWKASYGYSSDIAGVLIEAYTAVRRGRGRLDGYLQAIALAMPSVKARMSRRQRMHLYFILATGAAASEWYDEALYWVDRAIALAIHLEDIAAELELLSLRASCNRALLRLIDAIEDCRDSLGQLDAQHEALGVDDPSARLHTHAQLATFTYFTAQPDLARLHLAEARALTPRVPHGQFESATAEWVQAHLFRTYGEYERALRHLLGIYDDYIKEATIVSRERMEIFIADAALDWAEKLSPGADRNAFLALSLGHLETAERLASENDDQPGEGLAQLARVHYNRLSGANVERIARLEDVIHLGYTLDDVAIKAQAYTALGDEYAAAGERESALGCYRKALDVLEHSQVSVLGAEARRALFRP
ncbi:MAG TPA: hypothetical protein VFW76_10770 [Ktedonobacterales bacterium]|nr:hypothetical protein [Ktedonobacterales bacterium]